MPCGVGHFDHHAKKHTFNQLFSCRTKNIEHAPQPSTHEDVYIRKGCMYIYIYIELGRGETEKKDLGEGEALEGTVI